MRKLCCEICCGMSITQFEEMSADNSTAVRTLINTTTEKSASFVDPAWQIATAVEFYFRYAVIAIGIFGTAANGLVLYALIDHNARSVKKRVINLLIINQNLLDLLSCILLVICHSVAVSNISLMNDALGYFVCTVFIGESSMFWFLYASVMNLTILTIERYLN